MVFNTRSTHKNNSKKAGNDVELPIPVTLLSGFLGSGKTTLLLDILRNKEKLRCAVIVNDMASLNIDGAIVERAGLIQKKEELVQLQNGCICCTLRGDLLREVASLAKSNKFDYIVIESTGISEPMQVAETFAAPADMLMEGGEGMEGMEGVESLVGIAKLDSCVTVVDAFSFFDFMQNTKFLNEEFADAEEDDTERTVAHLLVDQIEFANIIILNKVDMVSTEVLKKLKGFVLKLNPSAEIIMTNYSKVPLSKVLNTGKFDMKEAERAAGWMKSLEERHVPETEEYGISSFIYSAERPFHAERLFKLLIKYFYLLETSYAPEDQNEKDDDDESDDDAEESGSKRVKLEAINEAPMEQGEDQEEAKNVYKVPGTDGEVEYKEMTEQEMEAERKKRILLREKSAFQGLLRSKGYFMMATRPNAMGTWAQTGNIITVDYSGAINIGDAEGEDDEDGDEDETETKDAPAVCSMKVEEEGEGLETVSSPQELVLIGCFNGDEKNLIIAELNACLLTDVEMDLFNDGRLDTFEDPWEEWPETDDHDHNEEGVCELGGDHHH